MKKRAKTFDLIVIGGGTSGLKAALEASHKLSVALVEPGTLGGTCLNNGCIPTKAMLHASHLYHQSQDVGHLGLKGKMSVDFRTLMKRVNSIVAIGQTHIKKSVSKSKLTLFKGKAEFVDTQTINVSGALLYGKKIIISTGAHNFVPPIPGIEGVSYLSNERILHLKKLPSSVVVVGGGYISMEFATFFSHLGCKVTILEASSHILGMLDEDIRENLVEDYVSSGVTLLTNVRVERVSESGKGTAKKTKTVISFADKKGKKTLTSDALFLATGRKPSTAHLQLSKTGVKLGRRGEILVNRHLQTSNHNIYAMGDVNGIAMFAHMAKREMRVALDNIYDRGKHKKHSVDYRFCPWVVFTDPPVGGVGLSETQARNMKLSIGVLKAGFNRAGRAAIMDDTRGFVKVIFDKKTRRVLGAAVIGLHADDIIHEFAVLLNSHSPTIDVIKRTIHVHPTLSEVIDSLEEV